MPLAAVRPDAVRRGCRRRHRAGRGRGHPDASRRPKVLHELAGKPLVWHALSRGRRPRARPAGRRARPRPRAGRRVPGSARRPAAGRRWRSRTSSSAPATPARARWRSPATLTGTVLVTYGDVPLLRTETLAALADEHAAAGNAVTVLTADRRRPDRLRPDHPRRRRRAASASSSRRTPTPSSGAIREVNSGVYAFDGAVLTDALGRLSDAQRRRRALPDRRGRHRPVDGRRVGTRAWPTTRSRPRGSTTGCSWPRLARVLNARLVRRGAARPGSPCTTRRPPGSTPTSPSARTPRSCPAPAAGRHHDRQRLLDRAGHHPDRLHGRRRRLGRPVALRTAPRSATGATVGPFSYLRPGAVLHADSKAGAFVEIKKSTGRRRVQGAAPVLHRRHHHRRRRQHRRRHDHRQLRRRPQVPHRHRRPRLRRQRLAPWSRR